MIMICNIGSLSYYNFHFLKKSGKLLNSTWLLKISKCRIYNPDFNYMRNWTTISFLLYKKQLNTIVCHHLVWWYSSTSAWLNSYFTRDTLLRNSLRYIVIVYDKSEYLYPNILKPKMQNIVRHVVRTVLMSCVHFTYY